MYAVMVDTVSGIFGGCAGKAVEYPADTVKVKLQAQGNTGASYTGPLDCARQTLRAEGVRGLYVGLPVPLLGSMAEMAVLFTAMGRIKRVVAANPEAPTLVETCLAGGGAGVCATFVLTPVELIKCRLQTRTYNGGSGGAVAAIRDALRTEGPRVLYKGFLGTLLREVPGTAAWFGMYEWTLGQLTRGAAADDEPAGWKVIAAGGAGGMGYWGAFYPADTVKTEMQTRSAVGRGGGAAPSFFQTFASIYRSAGLRGLYAGLGPTLLRAIPSNAAVFYVYDIVSRALLGMDSADQEDDLLA